MNISNNQQSSLEQKDFWVSLQLDILASNRKSTEKDYVAYIERSFIYSLFFRGCLPAEIAGFQNILGIKDYGYVLLLELSDDKKAKSTIDEFNLHYYLKKKLRNTANTIGPLITNRICILISKDTNSTEQMHRSDSLRVCEDLVKAIEYEFQVSVSAAIGRMQNIHSIYTSFIDTLSCIHNIADDKIVHYLDLKHYDNNSHFDYNETEKHLLEAIRLRKADAYDYFGLIMDWIRPSSDEIKRNRILELLILANHTMGLDSQNEFKSINYTGYVKKFMELEGNQLIEFAYQSFIYITNYVKPQTSIDYTNHIVKATREYLESHYADDISLEDMAEQVNISPQYLSKLIKKTTGFNFIDWLSMLRVKKAKELLTNSNLTVKEVCFMVGYKDPNYFSRIFKKRIGITPSEYVKTSSYLSNKN
jgi:two-component system, response regulator YesN